MEYTGLLLKYPVNRPLTALEHQFFLRQGIRLDVEPAHQLSVIQLNSTYMELVDKFFAWKGVLTIFAPVVILMFSFASANSIWSIVSSMMGTKNSNTAPENTWLALALDLVFLTAAVAPMIWLFRKESFKYTHYPIRLNRKTRTVHFFRTDESVLSSFWDKLYFCLGKLKQNNWEIQAHVLADDKETVLETFMSSLKLAAAKVSANN